MFIADLKIKMRKLKQRVGLERADFDIFGGPSEVCKFVRLMSDYIEETGIFNKYLEQFPEERRNLKQVTKEELQDEQRCGMDFLEFFIISYFSQYDCYGT